ncbi:peptidoglycan recognition protein family protein [Hymenobacter canadensis]|uniref:N-acetylmuramoyl-L-alanine amidase n=1 Tax=Hymenobacter canadensis TaxID=2999067 RepID=A0ABY7LV67_9BACT|nr:N-acetylmuramoyl-L-alanine amidase [Hymenobacter canadensis]WBA44283.1 N-acetylmuramoyl-L-alanine amidase [Hymenobacter canadensis]
MDTPLTDRPRHEVQVIIEQFPELSPATPADEQTLKCLQTKYGLLLQLADQSLRDRELRLKEGASRVDRWSNPLVVGIFAGALGLVGTFVNGFVSNTNQRVQLQNDLIKEAIKPATAEERAKSLVFFAKNGLITLDDRSLTSLIGIAGTGQPVPGSSAEATNLPPGVARPIAYVPAMVERVRAAPGVPYPAGMRPASHPGDTTRRAIILHDAMVGDFAVATLREGLPQLPGPLAHWAVQSNGTISFIADEASKANHVGRAAHGLSNFNTIGIEVTGIAALENERQFESLIRLVADVADRWHIPTERILSHAEVALPLGRKADMKQQAPIIRQMVAAVRKPR